MTPTLPDDALETLLVAWLPHQRWFAAKGAELTATRIMVRETLSRGDEPVVDHIVVRTEFTDHAPQLYQVPLGFRDTLPPELGQWALSDPVGRDVVAYDALRDPATLAVYARALSEQRAVATVRVRTVDDTPVHVEPYGHALGAEQSNTSVVLGGTLLLKVFRLLAAGVNPDVELHLALGRAESPCVARVHAWIEADVDGGTTTLAMVQDFEKNAADGWTTALGSVRDLMLEADLYADEVGTDFAAESHRMGAAVASVHATLARVLGTSTAHAVDIADGMRTRLEHALLVVPELAPLDSAIRARFDAVDTLGAVETQRIHGDLHLGQVLRTPERWLLIDFEGEPAKSLAQRRAPDSPLRDVAGMLRSFDYAAHFPVGEPDLNREFRAREWSDRNSAAFCDGYAAEYGSDPRTHRVLLDACMLDKAVYEAAYEKRNRPHWIALPLAAVEHIVGAK
ncbi:phosphotransferase [Rhodococcus sp. HNM0569]|uniref:maltokinase N-terminal cap-like domain-containing protein n=1 Tax=Rhodococcus sp. HNM0569 TaxID=2716340 RepID=UPI00146CA341|nr:phosphotransferase [Rhodococcus sp. HNM0569]NLU84881.1 phosphotransferase [Rhodococcus sp. HNM0569]